MKYLFALTAVSVSYAAMAQTERDLDSHVHGLASLNVAITDSAVFIELSTPWNNLVGFEHKPETDEQHAMVDKTLSQLNEPTQLFTFDAGECSVTDVDLENGMSGDAHDDEHEEEHSDEHAEKHDEEHADEEPSHSTVLVTYSYDCKQAGKLKSINTSLFSIWSGFEDLDVQLIGEGGQALLELNPNNTVLNVEQVQ